VVVDVEVAELHRLSVDEYHRILEAGGIGEDARVELLGGLLAAMSPKTRAHENAIAYLARRLMRGVDAGAFEVRVASPLTLEDSEPEPDLAVISLAAPRPYHPATAALVVEVAVSSLQRDLGVKSGLYARAGVTEYWVVDLDGRRLVVQREPNPVGAAYGNRTEYGPGRVVTASALELPPLDMAELLAAADA
jgi:Uma2 family endonuclease